MASLVWGNLEDRRYESGLSHGVLYPKTGPGVVWNGLVSVEDSALGGDVESFHFDGIKYSDLASNRIYQATLRAFSTPPEFDRCLGRMELRPGFSISGQYKETFDLSYKTKINEDDYKIHLVYNATAGGAKKVFKTRTQTTTPSIFEIRIDAVPPPSETFKPTAHFTIDSTKTDPDLLEIVEALLYGTSVADPELPSPSDLVDILNS